jgi:hypothetical protein
MFVLMAAMTPALQAELRYAACVVRLAVTGRRPIDPAALAAAHRALTQRRHHAAPAVRAAIDHYLDDDTLHHGPRALHDAVIHLTESLGIPPPEPIPCRWHQPRLFDAPPGFTD